MPPPPLSWDCPICLRKVPGRVSECYCGYKRSAPVAEVKAQPRGLYAAAAAFVVVAATAVFLLRSEPEPAPTRPADGLGKAAASPSSQAATPGIFTTLEPRRRRSAAAEMFRDLSTPTPEPTPSIAVPTPSAEPEPTPTPSPDGVEAMRERGSNEFDESMRMLKERVGELRRKIRQHDANCPKDQTRVVGCDASRAQIAIEAKEIQTVVDEAEDVARRSWVDPGKQRTLRAKHGVEDAYVAEALRAAAEIQK